MAACALSYVGRGVVVPSKKGYPLKRQKIEPKAGRIKRGRIGVPCDKRGGTIAEVLPSRSRFWKRIEQRLNGCGCASDRSQCGHVGIRDPGLAHPGPFIGPEKE